MANGRLTDQHKTFCKLYVDGKPGAESYRIAFKNDNQRSSAVIASKLLKKDFIKLHIAELQADNRKLIDKAIGIAADEIAKGSIADDIECKKFLTRVIRGQEEEEIIESRWHPIQKKFVLIPKSTKPTILSKIKAIADLSLMCGYNAPEKHAHVFMEVERTILTKTKTIEISG